MHQGRGLLSKEKMREERRKSTAYLGCGRSGFQDLVAAQTRSWRWCSASISPETGLFHDSNLSIKPFLDNDFLSETMRSGSPAGDDDVVRRDGAMPVHV